MFLNITALKKILTNSYKSTGLTVGRLHHQLIVCNTCLGFQIDVDFVPNKLKGILAELIGTFRRRGKSIPTPKRDSRQKWSLHDMTFMNVGGPPKILSRKRGHTSETYQ